MFTPWQHAMPKLARPSTQHVAANIYVDGLMLPGNKLLVRATARGGVEAI